MVDMRLDERLGYLVKRAEQAVTAATAEAVCAHQLTVVEFAVLSVLCQRPGSTNADLARGAFVSPQAMHRVVSALEHRGLLNREPGAGRAQPARLSGAGRALHARADADVAAMERQLTDVVGAGHAAELGRALEAMCEVLRPPLGATAGESPGESARQPGPHAVPPSRRVSPARRSSDP